MARGPHPHSTDQRSRAALAPVAGGLSGPGVGAHREGGRRSAVGLGHRGEQEQRRRTAVQQGPGSTWTIPRIVNNTGGPSSSAHSVADLVNYP
ncbi:hypothetical protein [Streptomyces sp. RPT161]|uniref:hypothetical protein n=1 Tax=Streptomyces sp. RPT161 TaxID=3015993 RepID=UPI0022B8EB4E|nr:hypothetical protein [Streptomyces sp. RPT161]